MAKALNVREWVSPVRQFGGTPKRDTVVGVSITLAAWLLGVSRSRASASERSEAVRGRRVRRTPCQDRSSGHAGLYRSSAARRAAEAHSVAINACITVCDLISDRVRGR